MVCAPYSSHMEFLIPTHSLEQKELGITNQYTPSNLSSLLEPLRQPKTSRNLRNALPESRVLPFCNFPTLRPQPPTNHKSYLGSSSDDGK